MAYLTSCGWLIEAHRFRWGRHDLDLVARRGPLVAFVEVKTRGSTGFGAPIESVRSAEAADHRAGRGSAGGSGTAGRGTCTGST